MTRGVYRIAQYPADRFGQYREAILWARASQGPGQLALSHDTALLVYGISDANPSHVHLIVPFSARLRRERPKWITVHHANLSPEEIYIHEGMPVTTVERSILDSLAANLRTEMALQAISDALREGLLTAAQAKRLRKRVNSTVRERSQPAIEVPKAAHESSAR
jgi:predicted transcriptional regulator of viral defense system